MGLSSTFATTVLFVLAFNSFYDSAIGEEETSIVTGPGGHALQLDYSQWVRLPIALSQALGREFSFEAWIQIFVSDTRTNPQGDFGSPTGTTALNRPIVSRFNTTLSEMVPPNPPNNNQNDFLLQVNPDGKLVFFVGGSNKLGFIMFSATTLEDYRWYHVAFSIEYGNSELFPFRSFMHLDFWRTDVHIGESQENFWDSGFNRHVLEDDHISIGKYHNTDQNWPQGQYFLGRIDEVRFWKGNRLGTEFYNPQTLLTNQTVVDGSELWTFSTPPGISRTDLIASYNFNDGSGTIVRDQVGGYHGIIERGPLNKDPNWVISEVNLFEFVDIVNSIPTVIELKATAEANITYEFVILYNSVDLFGELYHFVAETGGPAPTDTVTPLLPSSIPIPLWGAKINSGDAIVGNKVVFISKALSVASGGIFSYYARATNGDSKESRPADFLLEIECCCGVGQSIDSCGVCQGGDSAKDACGVCFGNNSTCVGCDGIPNSGLAFDSCGVCGGDGSSCGLCGPNGEFVRDACGVCNGDNSTCTDCNGVINGGAVVDPCGICGGDGSTCEGCDGVAGSGAVYDFCGVCGGNNGTCIGCDGYGGGEKDICGKCRGDNSTCGGCDGKGGVYDVCGVCGGDDSSCTCVKYRGFHTSELEYLLIQYDIDQIQHKIDQILKTFDITLEVLQYYQGKGDLGAMILYLNDFCEECIVDFSYFLDEYIFYLKQRVGLEYHRKEFTIDKPYDVIGQNY